MQSNNSVVINKASMQRSINKNIKGNKIKKEKEERRRQKEERSIKDICLGLTLISVIFSIILPLSLSYSFLMKNYIYIAILIIAIYIVITKIILLYRSKNDVIKSFWTLLSIEIIFTIIFNFFCVWSHSNFIMLGILGVMLCELTRINNKITKLFDENMSKELYEYYIFSFISILFSIILSLIESSYFRINLLIVGISLVFIIIYIIINARNQPKENKKNIILNIWELTSGNRMNCLFIVLYLVMYFGFKQLVACIYVSILIISLLLFFYILWFKGVYSLENLTNKIKKRIVQCLLKFFFFLPNKIKRKIEEDFKAYHNISDITTAYIYIISIFLFLSSLMPSIFNSSINILTAFFLSRVLIIMFL